MFRSSVFALLALSGLVAAGCVVPPEPQPDLCAPGEFSTTGEAPCTPAPVGTFVDIPGATEATPCPAGTTTDFEGATSELDCVDLFDLLAVAYTNLDDTDGYDPTTDVFIAKILDANDDGAVSIGDTVVTNRYPLDFDATGFGNFSTTSHTVTEIEFLDSQAVVVISDTGVRYEFTSVVIPEMDTDYEYFFEWLGGAVAVVRDDRGGAGNDIILINGSPSEPDTPVDLSRSAAVDDAFLEVDIFV